MPTYEITAPDGRTYEVTAPDGATEEQVLAYAQQNYKPQSKPDFSNARGSMGPTVRDQSKLGAVERFAGGVASAPADAILSIAEIAGLGSDEWRKQTRANIGAARSSTAGKVGQVGGEIGMWALPAAKVATVGRAIKGASTGAKVARVAAPVVGNAALGAGAGALHSTGGEGSRAQNAAIGAGAGLVGYGAGSLLGAGVRGLRGMVDPLTRAGQERIAALTLRNAAIDPRRLGAVAPSMVPGVQRNLAEESLDPGIAQLVRQFPQELAEQGVSNNEARVSAIRGAFNGASDDVARAIEGARDDMAEQTLSGLRAIRNPSPVPDPPNFFGSLGGTPARATQPPQAISIDPVNRLIGGMIPKFDKRPAVQATLNYVRSLTRGGVRDADEAYELRKTIGDLMEGKIGGDMAASKVARRQLMEVRDALDAEMSRAFPQWGQYLQRYKADSTLATQARVGEGILNRARQGRNPATGERMLTGNDLAGTVNNIDQVVKRAAGFRHANARNTLTDQQRGLLANLGDDANRMVFAQSGGRAPGSDTAQNLGTQALMSNMFGGGQLSRMLGGSEPAQRLLLSPLQKTLNLLGVPERLRGVTAELLGNPQAARTALANLNAQDRALVQRALAAAGAGAGMTVPFAAAAGQ